MSTKSSAKDPAFPTLIYTDSSGAPAGHYEGLTMRDYFAAKALPSIMHHNALNVIEGMESCTDDEMALDAYNIADAMLKQREL